VLDPQALCDGLRDRDGTRLFERDAKGIGVVGRAQKVDSDVGPDGARCHGGDVDHPVRVLGRRELAEVGDRPGLEADQRYQPALERALVQLHVVADAEPPDHVEQLLERDALGVEQQLVSGIEHAEVSKHLALWGQERCIAALARGQRLDVVGHLALQEAPRVRARERELAAIRAIEQARGLGDRAVLGSERVDGCHDDKDNRRAFGDFLAKNEI
jgi:hypothetical protein